jgi:hypothetical protein
MIQVHVLVAKIAQKVTLWPCLLSVVISGIMVMMKLAVLGRASYSSLGETATF